MKILSTFQTLISEATIVVIDARYDPYSIHFTYQDLDIKICDTLIQKNSQYHGIALLLNGLVGSLRGNGFVLNDLSDIRYLSEKSPKIVKDLDEALSEIHDKVKRELSQEHNYPYLFIDQESEFIQVRNTGAWSQTKKSVLKHISESQEHAPQIERTSSTDQLTRNLKEMYDHAPSGFQMTMVHLFGIKYADELESHRTKDIAYNATGKDSLWVELNKGIKLAKYVKIIGEESTPNEKQATAKTSANDNPVPVIKLTDDYKRVLSEYRVTIFNNARHYTHKIDEKGIDELIEESIPVKLSFRNFSWEGDNWRSLITLLGNYHISGYWTLDDPKDTHIDFQDDDLAIDCSQNSIGPLINHKCINNDIKKIDVIRTILSESDISLSEATITLRIAARYEPTRIVHETLKLEIRAFMDYLRHLGMSSDVIKQEMHKLNALLRHLQNRDPAFDSMLIEPLGCFERRYKYLIETQGKAIDDYGCGDIMRLFSRYKEKVQWDQYPANINQMHKEHRIDWMNLSSLQYTKPTRFILMNQEFHVVTWRDLASKVMNFLARTEPGFLLEKARYKFGPGRSRHAYITCDPSDLRSSVSVMIDNKPVYFEGNLSAKNHADFLTDLLFVNLGISHDEFIVYVTNTR
jgi:hypothetical protein